MHPVAGRIGSLRPARVIGVRGNRPCSGLAVGDIRVSPRTTWWRGAGEGRRWDRAPCVWTTAPQVGSRGRTGALAVIALGCPGTAILMHVAQHARRHQVERAPIWYPDRLADRRFARLMSVMGRVRRWPMHRIVRDGPTRQRQSCPMTTLSLRSHPHDPHGRSTLPGSKQANHRDRVTVSGCSPIGRAGLRRSRRTGIRTAGLQWRRGADWPADLSRPPGQVFLPRTAPRRALSRAPRFGQERSRS